MPGDDQRLQDLFPSFSADLSRAFHNQINDPISHVADAIDGHITAISDYLREVIVSTSWIPDSVKSSGPAVPVWRAPPPPPPGLLEQAQTWVSRHRAFCAAVISFIGTGAFLIWRRRRLYRMKRRAKRASGGGKMEVIVLAGSPYSQLASNLALDLDRRGFIVYMVISSRAEEEAVKGFQGKDIHALHIDMTSPSSIASAITKFSNELLSTSFQNILRLTSLIFLPFHPDSHQVTPVQSIASSTWSSTLNSQLLFPFTLTQAFLPILSAFAEESQLQHSTPVQKSIPFVSNFILRLHKYLAQGSRTSLIVLSSSINPSLCSANHALENVTFASISAWLTTLQSELAGNGSSLRIIHMRLGSLNDGSTIDMPKELAVARRDHHDIKSHESARGVLSNRSSDMQSLSSRSSSLKGTLSRKLQNSVFDAIIGTTARHGGTLFLGQGSLVYTMIGSMCPRTLVEWMMDRRQRVSRLGTTIDRPDNIGDSGWNQGAPEWEDIHVAETNM